MKAISLEYVKLNNGGGAQYIATIVHPTSPSSLTLTGADVDGMEDNDTIAAGSVLITPSQNYMTFDDTGVFTQKG